MADESDLAFIKATLDQIIDTGGPHKVVFPCPEDTPDEWYTSADVPRFILVLSGIKPIKCCIDGEVVTLLAKPGEALYMEPYAWTAPYWDSVHTFFSIISYHSYLRFVWGECDGNGTKPPPVFWHTAKGIDPAGFHVLQALNQLSRFPLQRCSGPALAESLLKLARVELDVTAESITGKAYQSYRTLCDYLNTHAHEPLSREDVAEELGISPSHISRLFQEQGGTSFSQYLLNLRMERAVSLLQQPERTIKEVGYYCGFRSDSYFIRIFKGYHGVSPGDWRNRAG